VRVRRQPALLVAALAAALVLVLAQPFTSPWWRYADADSIYVGSGLNIIHGDRTRFFDHPGLPLQEALAIVFAGAALVSGESPSKYAARAMANLDDTRAIYRTVAALLYLALVAFAFRVGRRELGGAGWGLAAALLLLAAPGLAPLSIQVRPDVLLCIVTLAVGSQLARAWRTREVAPLAVAAFLIGAGATVKIHAAGLLVALVVTAALRHPYDGWWPDLRSRARETLQRHRIAAGLAVAAWIAIAIALNALAWPFGPAPSQRRLLAEVLLVFGVFTAGAWLARRFRIRPAERLFDPLYGFLAAVVVAGVALPVSLMIGDGLTAIDSMLTTLQGHGVNQGVSPFAALGATARTFTVVAAIPTFAAAGIAGVVAVRRRDPWPIPWLLGCIVLTAMAAARSGNTYYFAPGYVLAIPPALWALGHAWRSVVPAVAGTAIAALALSPLADRPGTQPEGGRCHAAVVRAEASLLPGQVVLLPPRVPSRDERYWEITHTYVAWTPPYRYRALPDAPDIARSLGLTPRARVTALCRTVRLR
jgi:hypothetical protein